MPHCSNASFIVSPHACNLNMIDENGGSGVSVNNYVPESTKILTAHRLCDPNLCDQRKKELELSPLSIENIETKLTFVFLLGYGWRTIHIEFNFHFGLFFLGLQWHRDQRQSDFDSSNVSKSPTRKEKQFR